MEWRRGSNLTVDWADKILVPRTNRISLSHVDSRFTNPTTITFFFPLQICLLHMTSHVQQNIGFWIQDTEVY